MAEINETKFLGNTTTEVKYEDAASSSQTAASLASQAVTGSHYSAILGGILAAEAFTVAPIAEKGKIPVSHPVQHLRRRHR